MNQVFTAADLADMLARTLGDEKAKAIVDDAIGKMGFSAAEISRPEALALFEQISAQPGIVGISARFAKSRVHLLGADSAADRP